MNKSLITSNLTEAKEEIEHILECISDDPEFDEDEFRVYVKHLLHHAFFAWNARHATDHAYRHLTDKDFERWGSVPADLWEDMRRGPMKMRRRSRRR
jgi:hypothetical protein